MYRVTLILKSGVERKEFYAADHAQSYINSKKEAVLGFRVIQIPTKGLKKPQE